MSQDGEEFKDFSLRGSLRSSRSNKEPDILFDLAEDREGYLRDTNCINCGRKFNLPGIAHSKKLQCFFCYRGVCMNCLNFEYFHKETKKYEKMCSGCHHKLLIKSQKFNHELQLYRLERAELQKAIKLAGQQREIYVKDRQIAAQELEIAKKAIENNESGIYEEIDALRNTNKNLVSRVEQGKLKLQDKELKHDILMEKFSRAKKDLEKEKKAVNEELSFSSQFKGEMVSINPRLSLMKSIKAQEIFQEEDILERIEELKNEISKLEEVLDDKRKMNSDVCEILQELEEQIKENNTRIKELTSRLSMIKDSESDEFSDNEKRRLQELREQIRQLDDIIRINEDLKSQTFARMDTFFQPISERLGYTQPTELHPSPKIPIKAQPNQNQNCPCSCYVF